jgi:hypothetical protein
VTGGGGKAPAAPPTPLNEESLCFLPHQMKRVCVFCPIK